MGQQEVLNFLKSVRDLYVTTEYISKKTGLSVNSVRASLKKLYKQKEIIMIKGIKNERLYKLKEGNA